jgi:hypothetical protein
MLTPPPNLDVERIESELPKEAYATILVNPPIRLCCRIDIADPIPTASKTLSALPNLAKARILRELPICVCARRLICAPLHQPNVDKPPAVRATARTDKLLPSAMKSRTERSAANRVKFLKDNEEPSWNMSIMLRVSPNRVRPHTDSSEPSLLMPRTLNPEPKLA